jgi:small-conductance mechanosensitive channel
MQELLNGIQASFIGVVGAIIAFLPNLLAAIVLLIVGWLLGKLLGAIVTRVLGAVRFNEVADRAEIDTFLEKAGVKAGPSAVVGGIVRWAVYLVFFLAAFAALGLPQVSTLINSVIAYLPKVVLAVIVLLVGALVGKVMAGIVRGALGSMGMGNPELFANVARFVVIAFAVIAALDILEIAPTVVSALWIAFLALIVGSVALAFGLGGREAASQLMLGRMLRAEVEPGGEVTAGAYRGKVVAIGSLFTTMETPQGIVKVPNSQLTGQAVQMDQGQYEWQVQKREEMKQRAADGVRQQGSGNGWPGSRRPVA